MDSSMDSSLAATARALGITDLASLRANDVNDISNSIRIESNYFDPPPVTNATNVDDNRNTNENTTNNKKRSKSKRNVTSKRGRAGDPRMHRAVSARLANPKTSLLDALKAGGFEFHELATTGNKVGNPEAFDNDNVLLAQRKNQLSRRIRHARQALKRNKKKPRQSAKHENDDDADEGEEFSDEDDDDESFAKDSNVNLKQNKNPGQQNGSLKSRETTSKQKSTPKHHKHRNFQKNKKAKRKGNDSDYSSSSEKSEDSSSSLKSYNNKKCRNAYESNPTDNNSNNKTSQSQSRIPIDEFKQKEEDTSASSLNEAARKLSALQALHQHSAVSQVPYLLAQSQINQQHNNQLLAYHNHQPTIPTKFQALGGLNLSFFKTMAHSSTSAQLATDASSNFVNHLSHTKARAVGSNAPPKKRARKLNGGNSITCSVNSSSTSSTAQTTNTREISLFNASANHRGRRKSEKLLSSSSNNLLPKGMSTSRRKDENFDIMPELVGSLQMSLSKNLMRQGRSTIKHNDETAPRSSFSNLSAQNREMKKHPPILSETTTSANQKKSKKDKNLKAFDSVNSLEFLLREESMINDVQTSINENAHKQPLQLIKPSSNSNSSKKQKPIKKTIEKSDSTNSLELLLQSDESSTDNRKSLSLDIESSQKELKPPPNLLKEQNIMPPPEEYPQHALSTTDDPKMLLALENYGSEAISLFKRSLLFAGYSSSDIDEFDGAYLALVAKALKDDFVTWRNLRSFFIQYHTIVGVGTNGKVVINRSNAKASTARKANCDDGICMERDDTDCFSNASSFKKLGKSPQEIDDISHDGNCSTANQTADTEFTKQLVEIDSVSHEFDNISDLGSKSTISRLQSKLSKSARALSHHDPDSLNSKEDSKSESKALKSLSSESCELKSSVESQYIDGLRSTTTEEGTDAQCTIDSLNEENGDNELSGLLDLF